MNIALELYTCVHVHDVVTVLTSVPFINAKTMGSLEKGKSVQSEGKPYEYRWIPAYDLRG